MNVPSYRKLRGYAFDPSFSSTIGRRQSNEVIYKVRWENTTIGPVGEYIEVIDYDPTKECYYEPVNLEDPYVLADHGLDPSEGDPKFHQQQVYAVVMSVIAQFEKALGRKIIWTRTVDDERGFRNEFVPQLRIYPHALRQQNAFYSPEKVALLFGYFQASESWSGNNVPNEAVFTCLSPDIVAHETTHAILDSMHPYLRKSTNPDMLAFHEGFSDIIALLQRFTFTSVVEEQIRNSRGDLLSPQNLLGDLAIQFGQAVSGNRRALRSFLVEMDEKGNAKAVTPDPSKYHTLTDPHSRGGLLVAAVFDAFTRLYRYRVADLMRLASNGSGILAQGEIHPDLVSRLSSEACEIANKLMLICIRALDYCPPVDLTFGDFLRALITADVEHSPEDEEGLRFALMESFRGWGIIPKGINTYSVESLVWKPLKEYYSDESEVLGLESAIQFVFNSDIINQSQSQKNVSFQSTAQTPWAKSFTDLRKAKNQELRQKYNLANTNKAYDNIEVVRSMEKILRENDRREIYYLSAVLSAAVHNIFDQKFDLFKKDMERLLGMCFTQVDYSFFDENLNKEEKVTAAKRDKFQVYKCRPIIRNNNVTGTSSKLLIVSFLQKVYVDLKDTSYQGYLPNDQYEMRGGATLIIDLATYEIKYAIIKNIASPERLKEQLNHAMENLYDAENAALLMQGTEPFAALHSH